MRRLHEENLNNAEHFDRVWQIEDIHRFDRVRMEAFLEGIRYEDHMLDVGAGWMGVAQYAIHYDRLAQAWALDFSSEARNKTIESLAATPGRIHYAIGNALKIPQFDGLYDRVVCGELIEHMERPEDLVKELFRVCKPDGRVVISTVDDQCEDAKTHGDYPEHIFAWDSGDELLAYFAPYCAGAHYRLVGDYHFVEGVKR